MGPLNSGRSHQAAAGLAPRQPAIQVSSDRAEALADKLDITFDPRTRETAVARGAAMARLPLWELVGRNRKSPARHSCPATQLRLRDWGSAGEPAPRSRVIALGRIRSCAGR